MREGSVLQPLTQVPPMMLEPVRYLLTDVDDTITTSGALTLEALEALWRLKDAGIRTILVTGGSAGWADVYFRQWPVSGVITESGAIGWHREADGTRVRLDHPSIDRSSYRERADRLITRVLEEVPGSKLSVDQFCRIFDIAFDHHDERPYLDRAGVESILKICREEGASYGVSSIHVNCWFGTYDKLDMVTCFMEHFYGLSIEELKGCAAYCGDAQNDAPMFAVFPLSFGVGNLLDHRETMSDLPAFIAEKRCGAGFSQISSLLAEGSRIAKGAAK